MMRLQIDDRLLQVLTWGLALVVFKLVYTFFDYYNVIDFVVFCSAGFIINKKLSINKWLHVVPVGLPSMVICLIFLYTIGYDELSKGVGTGYLISLIVIPTATLTGYFASKKIYSPRKFPRK